MKDYLTANYHTHTKRCHHAQGTDREYVESAIRAGIKTLGFSDHIPIPDSPDEVAFIRMTEQETEGYVHSVLSLKEEYKNDIEIRLGFEGEYFPRYFDRQISFLKQIGYDYLILGQHYLENFGYAYAGSLTYDKKILTDYVNTCMEALSTGEYKYLCHPGLIYFRGEQDFYRSEMKRLCQYCKKLDLPMEINLLGIMTNRQYPNKTVLELMSEIGNKTILGIDAHNPEHIGNKEVYQTAMKMVERYGLELVETI